MTKLLCSVTTGKEALAVLEGGADIIDLKNPQLGALGALPPALVQEIVHLVAGRRPVSATIGDLPMQAGLISNAVEEMLATGVDMVKIGFFGKSGHSACTRALAPITARGARMVAVLFADDRPEPGFLPQLAQSGFHGVMLDTAIKNGHRLRHYQSETTLRHFVEAAHSLGLLVGLAGSLAVSDIPELMQIGPDYLGFRGALCRNSDRNQEIDPARVVRICDVLQKCNTEASEFA